MARTQTALVRHTSFVTCTPLLSAGLLATTLGLILLLHQTKAQSFFSSYASVCPKVECVFADGRQGRKCIETVDASLIKVSALTCGDQEECVILGGESGVCLVKTEEEKKLLFPGEYCDILDEVTYCAFGPQM
jgi:hypothetical protein